MGIFIRLLALLLPTVLLLVGAARTTGNAQLLFSIGAFVQVAVLCILFTTQPIWRGPITTPLTLIYLIALAWVWGTHGVADEWFAHLSQFFLLIVPLGLFAIQALADSGAFASRRANLLAERLANRKDWPVDLADCRTLPEVKALREALQLDASPALRLLQNRKPQARMAALAALEFRQEWAPGQAQLVLQFAQRSREGLLRAGAMAALGNLDDRPLIESVAEFLRDPDPEVRRATVDALLWDCETRWNWIRVHIRLAMADPALLKDGPLFVDGPALTPEAIDDLTAWAAEKGPISVRAAVTLGAFYQRRLATDPENLDLIHQLQNEVLNSHAPSVLRMELAQVLHITKHLEVEVQERLLETDNPAPLRLLAAEGLLSVTRHAQAAATLRDLARLPNREIALGTADVVQRLLGVDLGLALGQPLPPLHSRPATDVMRRLMKWAAVADLGDSPGPGSPFETPPRRKKSDSGTFGVASLGVH